MEAQKLCTVAISCPRRRACGLLARERMELWASRHLLLFLLGAALLVSAAALLAVAAITLLATLPLALPG